MTTKIKKLDYLAMVQVDLSIWSGQTKLNPEDFNLGAGGYLPSERVAQLGSKKIIDTSRLKPFHAKRQAYRRILNRVGMPFMNGHAIPISKLDEVMLQLQELELEFNNDKVVFLNEYDQAVNAWALDNPDMEEAIRACSLSRQEVEKRISFDYQVFKIAPLQEGDERLNTQIEGLGDKLIAEIISEAQTFYEKNIIAKNSLNTRTRSTLIGWHTKLEGLAFLSSSIKPLATLVQEAIDCYNLAAGGQLMAPYFWQVVGAVAILSDSRKVDDYLDGRLNSNAAGKQAEAKAAVNSASHEHNQGFKEIEQPQEGSLALFNSPGLAPEESNLAPVTHDQHEELSIDDFFAASLKVEKPVEPVVDQVAEPKVLSVMPLKPEQIDHLAPTNEDQAQNEPAKPTWAFF